MYSKYSIVRLLLIMLLIVVLSLQEALAAPPYKLTISGPGINGEIEVWLATDDELLTKLDSGLQPDNSVNLSADATLVYDVTWYYGRCWTESQPCTEDPDGVVVGHQSRYLLDTSSGIGYISHQNDLGAWAGYGDEWYQVSNEFNQVLQLLLIEIYAGIR